MYFYSLLSTDYVYVGKGSCLNSHGRHPPYEWGHSVNNSPSSCYDDCQKRAAALGKRCTGFDTRTKCVYYFDEEITTNKIASYPIAPACFKVAPGNNSVILETALFYSYLNKGRHF